MGTSEERIPERFPCAISRMCRREHPVAIDKPIQTSFWFTLAMPISKQQLTVCEHIWFILV